MKLLSLLSLGIIFSLIIGCTPTSQPISSTQEATRREALADSIRQVLFSKQGRVTYERFKSKYWKEDTTPVKIPSQQYSYAKAYRFTCLGECGPSDILRDQYRKEITLTKTQLRPFLKLIQNKNSYGAGTAACFNPKLAVVFYDNKGIPMEYIAICLGCNNVESYPNLKITTTLTQKNINYGFTIPTRNALRAIFKEWQLPYEEYSELFDTPEDWGKYKRERLLKTE